jgi:hypothetical protein
MTIAINQDQFTASHWMYVPVGDPEAHRGHIALSGVVAMDFAGNSTGDWRRERFTLNLGRDLQKAMQSSVNPPAGVDFWYVTIRIDSWTVFATVTSRSNAAGQDGTAVDDFGIVPDQHPTTKGQADVSIWVDAAVLGEDTRIFRIGYQVQLLGSVYIETAI